MSFAVMGGERSSDSSSNVPVATLLLTVLEAIIEVFLLCSAGYVLARVGIADKATQRKLNVINVSLFTPCLLFGKIAFSLTPSKLKELWVIPLSFVLVTGVSAAVAYAMGSMAGLTRSQRAYGIACAMFQNSNSLPIALIQSLVDEVPGLKWGDDDTRDAMLGRALTYLVLYSTLGMMLRWSYGVQLLSQADEAVPTIPTEQISSNIVTAEPESMMSDASRSDAQPHPGAQETDPLFSSGEAIKRDERDELEMDNDALVGLANGVETDSQRERRMSGLSATSSNFAWTASSAHSMHPIGNGNSHHHGGASTSLPNPSATNVSRSQTSGGLVQPGSSAFSRPSRSSSGGNAIGGHASGSGTGTGNRSTRPRQMSRTESGRQFWGLPEAAKSRTSLSDQEEVDESEEDEDEDEEWGDSTLPGFIRRRSFTTPPHSRLGSFFRQVRNRSYAVWMKLYMFMTMPMWAGVASIVIACIPPLQRTLVASKPLTQAIKGAGQCSIPVTLVVLGAFFYTPPPPAPAAGTSKPSRESSKRTGTFFERKLKALAHPLSSKTSGPENTVDKVAEEHAGENRTVFVAVVSRMIVVPAILLPLLALVARYDWFEAAEDPVFILAATLIISSPTALTISQLTEAANGLAFERLITKTISWSYAGLTPPLTVVYVVIGLVFGRL